MPLLIIGDDAGFFDLIRIFHLRRINPWFFRIGVIHSSIGSDSFCPISIGIYFQVSVVNGRIVFAILCNQGEVRLRISFLKDRDGGGVKNFFRMICNFSCDDIFVLAALESAVFIIVGIIERVRKAVLSGSIFFSGRKYPLLAVKGSRGGSCCCVFWARALRNRRKLF